MTTKKGSDLTLRDRLSRLTFTAACKLLGEEGEALIRSGGAYEIDIAEQVELDDSRLRVSLDGGCIAEISLSSAARSRIALSCSACGAGPCEHLGAALSLVLEEKTALGLAAPPPERVPVESLPEEDLVRLAIAERAARAAEEKMTVASLDPNALWTDYLVTNKASGKTYRVALRGWVPGESYCSCPDFRKNTLGTCKHVIHVAAKVRRRFPAGVRNTPYVRTRFAVHLRYGEQVDLRLLVPDSAPAEALKIAKPFSRGHIEDVRGLVAAVTKLEALGCDVVVHPDAEEYVEQQLVRARLEGIATEIRRDPASHPLRRDLLAVELLPYQLDGVAFAASARRAVLADDMGLGKTIQGVGVAELLAREGAVERVLVVCPASLKSQWRNEARRFSSRSAEVVVGSAAERAEKYAGGAFFTICNYEQVLRDIEVIETVKWDLIILDEGQRIKNWEAKTSRIVKGLKSPFALVLTGTPLENRLDDLFSIVEFVDERRLGPAFRFFNRHRVVDEKGKVLGYKRLDELRERLRPTLLRRTRESVRLELPPRQVEFVRIAPTDEQLDIHGGQMRIVSSIIRKRFLTEMDMLRLRKALLMCRMAADSSFLVTKQAPGYSSKLEELDRLLERLAEEEDRKIVLFSEWTTMLDLTQPLLDKHDLGYVRLDGSVPQKQREPLVETFRKDPKCRAFITTNAGSTGLNLQAANTVINVDLPWNPAVLEQRIGRAHRMGQERSVQVFVLVTEETIEENLLATLAAKRDLSLAALDAESQVESVSLVSNIEELRGRLEILLGAKPEAPVDESVKREEERVLLERRERVAIAGGQLLGAAFAFLGEVLPRPATIDEEKTSALAGSIRASLGECLEKGEDGRVRFAVTLPDEAAMDALASSLAALLSSTGRATISA
jgi:superfamily II DNA or RNA helicase